MSNIAIQIASPYVTKDQYARMSGLPEGMVNKMVSEGRLPIRPKNTPKERVLINVLALCHEAANHC